MVSDLGFLAAAGAALRRARTARGLTLREVSAASRGRFKPSVVGGYERGSRAISLGRFCELARFYGVPPDRLLADALASVDPGGWDEVVLDLTKLSLVRDEDRRTVAEYVGRLRAQRGDFEGEVLTLRAGDVEHMALRSGSRPARLLSSLRPAIRRPGPR